MEVHKTPEMNEEGPNGGMMSEAGGDPLWGNGGASRQFSAKELDFAAAAADDPCNWSTAAKVIRFGNRGAADVCDFNGTADGYSDLGAEPDAESGRGSGAVSAAAPLLAEARSAVGRVRQRLAGHSAILAKTTGGAEDRGRTARGNGCHTAEDIPEEVFGRQNGRIPEDIFGMTRVAGCWSESRSARKHHARRTGPGMPGDRRTGTEHRSFGHHLLPDSSGHVYHFTVHGQAGVIDRDADWYLVAFAAAVTAIILYFLLS